MNSIGQVKSWGLPTSRWFFQQLNFIVPISCAVVIVIVVTVVLVYVIQIRKMPNLLDTRVLQMQPGDLESEYGNKSSMMTTMDTSIGGGSGGHSGSLLITGSSDHSSSTGHNQVIMPGSHCAMLGSGHQESSLTTNERHGADAAAWHGGGHGIYFPSPYATTRVSMYGGNGDTDSECGQQAGPLLSGPHLQRSNRQSTHHPYDVPFRKQVRL